MAIRSVILLLSLSLVACVAAVDHPTFEEGDVNSTINVGAVLLEDKTLRCTVKNDSESELKEINIIPAPTGPEDNWELKKSNEEGWAEVTIKKVADSNEGRSFTCEAEDNNDKNSFLTYNVTTIYNGTTFMEGEVNSTIPTNLLLGTTSEIRCTVKNADPPVTGLTIEPVSIDPNLGVIGDGKTWIGISFKTVTDTTPTEFVCSARSDVTVAQLTYSITLIDSGITFSEGPTNGTLNRTLITETTDEFTCTVKSSESPITDLFIEPTPPPGDKDYEVIKNNDTSITVKFLKITSEAPESFKCTAKTNKTMGTLEYRLAVKDPVAPLFTMGGNDTIWREAATGSNYTLTCTVIKGVAIPEATLVVANPPSDKNWEVVKKDDFSVEIQITKADSALNKRDYECYATNGLRSTNLTYQNYVGGPPKALDVTVHSVINKDNMDFSLSVTDRNTAPAQNILVYIAGVTDENVTLRVPIPDNYDNEIQYGFDKFLTKSLSAIRENPQMTIYANNTLGDAYIKDIGIAVPVINSSKSNSGAIAAGVLVPLFVVLGAVIIGAVVFYFWRKGNKGKNVSFSKINNDIEDAQGSGSSTYGAL